MEAGTWPTRKPGRRASFWYFWISESVSRATSAAGISTWISRLTLSFVSVGLTFYLSHLNRVRRPFERVRTVLLASLSVKTGVEQRQTGEEALVGRMGSNNMNIKNT